MKSYTLSIAKIFYFVWARTVCLTVRCNTLLILIATFNTQNLKAHYCHYLGKCVFHIVVPSVH